MWILTKVNEHRQIKKAVIAAVVEVTMTARAAGAAILAAGAVAILAAGAVAIVAAGAAGAAAITRQIL